MTIRFHIEKRKNADGQLLTKGRPVFMTVSFHGKRVLLSTGVKLDIDWWDQHKQRVKGGYPEADARNAWLDSLSETAGATWKALANLSDKPGTAEFRSLFSELRPRYSPGFFEIFYRFMEERSPDWNASTYRKVRTIYNHLRDFEVKTGYTVTFRSLNDDFIGEFAAYYRERGNSHITTCKAVNILVWFLNWATENGYNVFRHYRSFYRSLESGRTAEGSRPVALDWEELMRVWHCQPEERKLERVRDLFCFTCFTGIRFSELRGLVKEDIGEDEVVVRPGHKRSRRVPLNSYSREITGRYRNRYFRDNTAFPQVSLVTFNRYLREVCRIAGVVAPVQPPRSAGEKVPKYMAVTAGTGVNTFLANAIKLGIPPAVIAGFTGVKKDNRYEALKGELMRSEIKKFDDLDHKIQEG